MISAMQLSMASGKYIQATGSFLMNAAQTEQSGSADFNMIQLGTPSGLGFLDCSMETAGSVCAHNEGIQAQQPP